ncbi:MAG: carbohydrate ABC transporter permease [Clostridia bacterium]
MKKNQWAHLISTIGFTLVRVIMLVYAVIVLFPMLWTFMSSLKTTGEFYLNVWALPRSLKEGFQNYVNAWNYAEIGQNIVNSFIAVGASLVLNVLLCTMTAYAITRYKFHGHKLLSKLYIAGLFVPLVLGTIPTFFVLLNLHLYDTLLGLILVYTAYSMPFSVFIMMGIFETLPNTFAEAAALDGCGHFRTFWNVMLPLSRSGLVTISIFHFLWTWNDYIYAMTYVTSASKRTLSVGLVKLTSMATYRTDWGALFAGLVIVMIPSLIVYIIFQNQIQQGLTSGGIKG